MSKTNFVDGDPSQGILGTVVPADYLNALNNHYHTGLDQDGHGALPYGVETGTANSYVVTLSPALSQYVIGMPIYFKATNTNTSAGTINVNGLGGKTIKKNGNADLVNGDIQAGQIIGVSYDGTYMQLITPPSKTATLDADTRVVQAANLVWDGTAGRFASPTPAANTIPVSGTNNALARGFIPDNVPGIMTGEASARVTTNNIVTLDLGSVTAGDRILVEGHIVDQLSAAPTTAYMNIAKNSGTATILFANTVTSIGGPIWYSSAIAIGSLCGMCRVTGNGTLILQLSTTYTSGTFTAYDREIYAVFLKKQ